METFKKRHKETPRLQRQKDKAARRIQRKQNRAGDMASDDTPKAGPEWLALGRTTHRLVAVDIQAALCLAARSEGGTLWKSGTWDSSNNKAHDHTGLM
jgi:hypothetical protein